MLVHMQQFRALVSGKKSEILPFTAPPFGPVGGGFDRRKKRVVYNVASTEPVTIMLEVSQDGSGACARRSKSGSAAGLPLSRTR